MHVLGMMLMSTVWINSKSSLNVDFDKTQFGRTRRRNMQSFDSGFQKLLSKIIKSHNIICKIVIKSAE